MKITSQTLLLLSFMGLLLTTHAYHPSHGCEHRPHNEAVDLVEVEQEPLPSASQRLLATSTTTSYPQIRITADYTNLLEGSTEFISYVKTELMPAVIDYFQAAFQIKQAVSGTIKLSSTTKTVCGYTTPSALWTGASTDYFLVVSSESDTTSSWVASAGACYLASGTKRPIIGTMLFNLYYTTAPNGDALIHEKNMYLTMHEMLHALGFTMSSFKNFIDADGNTLTNQFSYYMLDGSNRTILNVEPLTTKLRDHFGCSTLPGAFLENDGGSGTAGSHFERRHFLYEAMTSGVIQGLRLSEFSFAVMEGSGWYMPNYTYADPFFVGKGEGCGFLYTSCSSSSILNYKDFCGTASSRGCGIVGVAGGVCSSDTRSDGCKYYIPVLQYHCENADATSYARLSKYESYGRTVGSKCFNGNLTTSSATSNTSMCFKYQCNGSGSSTTLKVYFGSGYFTCKAESTLKISGFSGYFQCPDPETFCETVGLSYCRLGCSGRGTCVDDECVCNDGYTGIDCAMNE